MLREFMETIAITLFDVMGGYPLTHDIWPVILWVTITTLPFAVTLWYFEKTNMISVYGVLTFIFFISGFFLSIVPNLIQSDMLTQCEKEETEIIIGGDTKTMVVTYCRKKENINGEYGQWKPNQQVEYK